MLNYVTMAYNILIRQINKQNVIFNDLLIVWHLVQDLQTFNEIINTY